MTLVQYGFSMKSGVANSDGDFSGTPQDPNSHDFDPTMGVATDAAQQAQTAEAMAAGISTSDWFAYILMIVGWFILIRSISNFLKARRHEQLVLQSPDRGLGIPIVAEGEAPATVV